LNQANKKGNHFEIVVIDAGFASLNVSIHLKMTGSNNFIIFEKAAEIGGTWSDNI